MKGKTYMVLEPTRFVDLEPKPAVRKLYVTVPKPTLSDARPDHERLVDALMRIGRLDRVEIDYNVLKGLPVTLRQSNFNVTVDRSMWHNYDKPLS